MELKRAKEVLEGMNLWRLTPQIIISKSGAEHFISAQRNSRLSVVEAELTADEHEAIATWMRDPEGVVKA